MPAYLQATFVCRDLEVSQVLSVSLKTVRNQDLETTGSVFRCIVGTQSRTALHQSPCLIQTVKDDIK